MKNRRLGTGYPPRTPSEWVDRIDLVDRLVDSRDKRLILISAPAGYGKSTLIAQWRAAARETRAFAYVALDRSDNDPISLWTDVLETLSEALPDFRAGDIIADVRRPLLDSVLLSTVLDRLDRLARPVVIVLDDFDTICEPVCHQQVALLLRHAPPTCQLAIASRGTPRLSLARLRAAGEILEIHTADLRFTVAELGPFLRRVSGGALTDAAVAALAEQSEGWPAGAYLTALAMRGRDGSDQLVRGHAGGNRYVLDYLSEEVLGSVTDEVRRFLVRTSVLDRFTAPLCDAVAGTSNAAHLLEDLERRGLFLIPLDGDQRWYRYHNAFALALRAQLVREGRAAEQALHETASSWLEDAGLIDEAVEHAFAAGDVRRVIDVVTKHWPLYLYNGHHMPVEDWLARLGNDTICQDPAAAVCAAWLAGFTGDRQAVRRWLATAEGLDRAGPLPDGTASVASAVALIRATFGLDGLDQLLRSARIAAELETDPASIWYGLARSSLGYGLYLAGHAHAAIEPLEQAAQSRATLPVVRVTAMSVLSLVSARLGRHAAATELATGALELVRAHDLANSALASLAFTAFGAGLAREGRLDPARQALEHSLRLRRRVSGMSPWPTLDSLVLLANVALDQNDKDEARALHDEAADLLSALPDGGGQVLADLQSVRDRLAGAAGAPQLGVPLTKRELTVLRLLQGSLSLSQIAGQLFLSANTVKTHTRLIYQKLGVSTRRDAVQRARELGLL